MTINRNILAAGVLAAGLVLTTGVLAQSSFDLTPQQAARPHTSKSDAVVALISKDHKFANPGELTVAITLGSPPIGTYATDSATPVGGDPDIASLLAEKFGLKLNLVPTAWPDWPLGVLSGKFDAVISNVTVTEERKEKLDFSTYRKDVLGFYVKSDSKITSIKEPKDAAGLKIITGSGTNQEKILLEWDKQNKAAGLKPIEFQYYDDAAAAQLALASGRADAQFDPNSALAYWAATDGKTKLVGIVSGGWPLTADIAVTTRKGAGLAEAFTAAINEIIADGTYAKALKRWSLDAESVDKSETNPPGLPKT